MSNLLLPHPRLTKLREDHYYTRKKEVLAVAAHTYRRVHEDTAMGASRRNGLPGVPSRHAAGLLVRQWPPRGSPAGCHLRLTAAAITSFDARLCSPASQMNKLIHWQISGSAKDAALIAQTDQIFLLNISEPRGTANCIQT